MPISGTRSTITFLNGPLSEDRRMVSGQVLVGIDNVEQDRSQVMDSEQYTISSQRYHVLSGETRLGGHRSQERLVHDL